MFGDQHMSGPEPRGVAKKSSARPKDFPERLGLTDGIERMAAESEAVKTGGPRGPNAVRERHDPVVVPRVDDAVHRAAVLAYHAQDLERHPLEAANQHHPAAACDDAQTGALARLHRARCRLCLGYGPAPAHEPRRRLSKGMDPSAGLAGRSEIVARL